MFFYAVVVADGQRYADLCEKVFAFQITLTRKTPASKGRLLHSKTSILDCL